MKFRFAARIYKVGINPCVKVPLEITNGLRPVRGYIPVKGKIGNHKFRHTLVPVKNSPYRLYVNGPMLKGSGMTVGQTVEFVIEQDSAERNKPLSMPVLFRKALEKNKLQAAFKELIPSRQKDILKYLNHLKTEKALLRNINKVIGQLKSAQ
jgi:hypothetical protein